MKKKIWVLVAGVVASGVFAAVASAAVTFDPTCPYTASNATGKCGFVGKGNVQTVLGWNNDMLQKNAKSLAFTYSQPASQALSQDATQAGTQTGTQSMSEDLSCTVTVGGGRVTFHRDGSRDGSRNGSRDGTRSGSRAGTSSGKVSYTIAFDPRIKNQINGFFLTGATSLGFAPSGDPVWGAFTWGAFTFGDFAWGDTTWGDWVSEPGENPASCLGNPGATDVVDTVTPGTITALDPTPGTITPGNPTPGDVTPTGPATLSVNGKALN